MTLVGCDLHSRKQQVPVFDITTGEILEQSSSTKGDAVERFYRALRPPVRRWPLIWEFWNQIWSNAHAR